MNTNLQKMSSVHQGWARYLQWGLNTVNHINGISNGCLIEELVCQLKKMSAMLEELQSLPGENEIQTEISRLFGK